MAGWNVEYTDQFEAWWLTLSMDEQSAVTGNKERRWQEWCQDFIPIADTLYDEHLDEIRQQGETT